MQKTPITQMSKAKLGNHERVNEMWITINYIEFGCAWNARGSIPFRITIALIE